MKIIQNNSSFTIFFSGRLDKNSAPSAEKEITDCLACEEVSGLTLDLKELEFISSAGLRLILSLKKKYDCLSLINIRPAVYDVLHITSFDEIFGLETPEEYVYIEKLPNSAAGTAPEAEYYNETPEFEFCGINDTTEEYAYCSVIDMFTEQAEKHPDKTAVVTPTESITYAKLDEMSNKVANFLVFMGVKQEDVIMILLPRGIEAYIAALGVLKAGAAYTIVHADYPDDRIEYIFGDANCKFMISNKRTVIDRLELVADVLQRRPLYMEEMLSNPASYSTGVKNGEHDLCYLIYTSGSTGKPKGVMIEHGNLSNFVYPTSKNYEANGLTQKGTVLLAMAQMTFDVSVMEMYLGLTSGMTVALATEEEILNPSKMKEFMLKNHVDAVCFTPAYANTLVSIPEMKEAIRNIVTYDFGAEAFPGNLFTKIRAINPDAYIMNGYGPTEATISCTMKIIESPDDITIGKPNANVYTFIADESLNEVPKGEIGELIICGKGVGRGYRNLPEKTAETFIHFKGMRAYRTGDLARITENDEIEFHGRKDNQVKLRGLRIELDEIEKVIAGHPEVKQSAAKVFDNRILVGYYTLRTAGSVSKDDVEKFVRGSLAHYMVPEVFVELEDMPMTPNKKIDRKALEKPEISDAEVVPPENETQEKLVTIVGRLFEDMRIGITTNILDLGLSSLDTMILAANIGDEFDVDVNFNDIAGHPTVVQLEEMIASKCKKTGNKLKDSYAAMDIVAFMTADLFSENASTVFNLPYLYRMRLSTDTEKLEKAVTDVLNAHDGLWAGFEMCGERIMICQRKDHDDYVPSVTELSEERLAERRDALKRVFSPDGLMFRVEIYKTEKAVYLFTDFHHSIIDADSYEILITEIFSGYDGKEIKHESFSAFDLHDEAERYLENGGTENAVEYYEELFKAADGCNSIPKDKQAETLEIRRYSREFEKNVQEITETAKSMKISPSVLFLGLTAAYNAHSCGKRSAYLNIVYNGRNDSRKIATAALLTTSFPAFVSWKEDTKVGDHFFALQQQLFNSMGILSQPFTYLLTNHPDTFESGFSYLGNVSYDYRTADGDVRSEALSPEGTGGAYGIYEEIYEHDGRFFFNAEYRANQYNEDTLCRMFEGISAMISKIGADMKMDDLVKGCCE